MIAILRDIINVCVALVLSPVARRIFVRILANHAVGAAKVGLTAFWVLFVIVTVIDFDIYEPAPDAPTTAPAPAVVEDSQGRQHQSSAPPSNQWTELDYHADFTGPEIDALETWVAPSSADGGTSSRDVYVHTVDIWTQPTWVMTTNGTSMIITNNKTSPACSFDGGSGGNGSAVTTSGTSGTPFTCSISTSR
jgi:hypothetical protein